VRLARRCPDLGPDDGRHGSLCHPDPRGPRGRRHQDRDSPSRRHQPPDGRWTASRTLRRRPQHPPEQEVHRHRPEAPGRPVRRPPAAGHVRRLRHEPPPRTPPPSRPGVRRRRRGASSPRVLPGPGVSYRQWRRGPSRLRRHHPGGHRSGALERRDRRHHVILPLDHRRQGGWADPCHGDSRCVAPPSPDRSRPARGSTDVRRHDGVQPRRAPVPRHHRGAAGRLQPRPDPHTRSAPNQ
jgi:hypothetical protein